MSQLIRLGIIVILAIAVYFYYTNCYRCVDVKDDVYDQQNLILWRGNLSLLPTNYQILFKKIQKISTIPENITDNSDKPLTEFMNTQARPENAEKHQIISSLNDDWQFHDSYYARKNSSDEKVENSVQNLLGGQVKLLHARYFGPTNYLPWGVDTIDNRKFILEIVSASGNSSINFYSPENNHITSINDLDGSIYLFRPSNYSVNSYGDRWSWVFEIDQDAADKLLELIKD